MAPARLQLWALMFSAYDYAIAYKPGAQNGITDLLSWLPLPEAPTEVPSQVRPCYYWRPCNPLPSQRHRSKPGLPMTQFYSKLLDGCSPVGAILLMRPTSPTNGEEMSSPWKMLV